MKSLKWRNIQSISKSSSFHQLNTAKTHQSFPAYFSCIPKLADCDTKLDLTLTQEELTKINLLIPRLCVSHHQTTAIQLFTTALMANPDPKSLSISILIHSLTLQSDMKLSMSLLTRLKHAPESHSSLPPITAFLISSYLKQDKPKNALKVYNWVTRPDSPFVVEKSVYGILVGELCRIGLVLEGLMILRDMVKANLKPGERLRERIFGSLLREARIKEGMELKEALCRVGDGNDGVQKVLNLLDLLIRNWTE